MFCFERLERPGFLSADQKTKDSQKELQICTELNSQLIVANLSNAHLEKQFKDGF